MRTYLAVLGSWLCLAAFGQLELPTKLEFEGPLPTDRQVTGLADPIASDAAVSLAAARAMATTFAAATGTTIIAAELSPAPAGYAVGMAVTIVPAESNDVNASLNLNGLGERPIVKFGQVPLDSADMQKDVPARLVYDGTKFHLLNNTYRPCPSGFYATSGSYCIEDSSSVGSTFYEAITACMAKGARLCGYAEWTNACRTKAVFIASVIDGEWVDDAANNGSDAKVVGAGWASGAPLPGFACNYGFTYAPATIKRSRCCYSR